MTPAHPQLLVWLRRQSPPRPATSSPAGFLPDHNVTIRVTYTAENISDHLSYNTDPGGDLYAQLLTSPATGAPHIAATDHRTDHRRRMRAGS